MNNFLIYQHLLQQNLILHNSCFDTEIVMQNRTAMQWQPKLPKEGTKSQSNVILEESTKKFENIQLQKTKTSIFQA